MAERMGKRDGGGVLISPIANETSVYHVGSFILGRKGILDNHRSIT